MTIPTLPADITQVDVTDALIELHGHDLAYNVTRQEWLIFDEETGWAWDHQGSRVHDVAVATLRHLEGLAPNELTGPHLRRFQRTRRSRARQMMTSGSLGAILTLASKRVDLSCPDGAIDAESYLVGTPSGVLDLRNGTVSAFARSQVITRRLPADYDAGATCPRWTRFLDEVLGCEREVHNYLQELLGYTMTGETREQKMWLLVGNGSNGKSTLLRQIQALLGSDYAQTTPEAVLFGRPSAGGASDELVRLRGTRCAVFTESGYGESLNEERVKSLVSGDRMSARGLYRAHEEFTPQAKYFLATNHLPTVRGSDKGVWRRLVVVPFTAEFEVGSDLTLRDDLDEELPGIIAWAVAGAMRWYRHGRLAVLPTSWEVATGRYRAEQDVVTAFLGECATIELSARVGATELFDAFSSWCIVEGRQSLNQQDFGRRMTTTGLVTRARHGQANRHHYFGVRLRQCATEMATTGD